MSKGVQLYDTVEAIAAEYERRKSEIEAVKTAADAAGLDLKQDYLTEHKRDTWNKILTKSNARQWMTTKQEAEVTARLWDKPAELPEITVESLRRWLQDLVVACPEMIRELCREAFEILTPQKRCGDQYKSNADKREIPKTGRVVLTWMCENNKWTTSPRLSYSSGTRQKLEVLDRVFSLLDRRPKPERPDTAVCLCEAASEKGESEAVTFWGRLKMHLNGNLHVWLTRKDLVDRLVKTAAGKNLGAQEPAA